MSVGVVLLEGTGRGFCFDTKLGPQTTSLCLICPLCTKLLKTKVN